MTSGNGALKKNSAQKASTATIRAARPFNARFDTRKSASITITATAACTPMNTACISGTVP